MSGEEDRNVETQRPSFGIISTKGKRELQRDGTAVEGLRENRRELESWRDRDED